jgi:hypothetical protein
MTSLNKSTLAGQPWFVLLQRIGRMLRCNNPRSTSIFLKSSSSQIVSTSHTLRSP